MKLITAPTVEYSAELTVEEFQVLGLLDQIVRRGSDGAGTSPGLSDSSALKAPNSSSHGLLHLEHLLFPILKLPKFFKVLSQDQFFQEAFREHPPSIPGPPGEPTSDLPGGRLVGLVLLFLKVWSPQMGHKDHTDQHQVLFLFDIFSHAVRRLHSISMLQESVV